MSEDYRVYDDHWQTDPRMQDELTDVSTAFNVSQNMMNEIATMLEARPTSRVDMERLITNEMAEVVFGSNQFKRLGVDLAETLRLCLMFFEGSDGLRNVERYVGHLYCSEPRKESLTVA